MNTKLYFQYTIAQNGRFEFDKQITVSAEIFGQLLWSRQYTLKLNAHMRYMYTQKNVKCTSTSERKHFVYVIQCNGDPYDDSSDLPSDILVRALMVIPLGYRLQAIQKILKKIAPGTPPLKTCLGRTQVIQITTCNIIQYTLSYLAQTHALPLNIFLGQRLRLLIFCRLFIFCIYLGFGS